MSTRTKVVKIQTFFLKKNIFHPKCSQACPYPCRGDMSPRYCISFVLGVEICKTLQRCEHWMFFDQKALFKPKMLVRSAIKHDILHLWWNSIPLRTDTPIMVLIPWMLAKRQVPIKTLTKTWQKATFSPKMLVRRAVKHGILHRGWEGILFWVDTPRMVQIPWILAERQAPKKL